jgi:hypothetical protein
LGKHSLRHMDNILQGGVRVEGTGAQCMVLTLKLWLGRLPWHTPHSRAADNRRQTLALLRTEQCAGPAAAGWGLREAGCSCRRGLMRSDGCLHFCACGIMKLSKAYCGEVHCVVLHPLLCTQSSPGHLLLAAASACPRMRCMLAKHSPCQASAVAEVAG